MKWTRHDIQYPYKISISSIRSIRIEFTSLNWHMETDRPNFNRTWRAWSLHHWKGHRRWSAWLSLLEGAAICPLYAHINKLECHGQNSLTTLRRFIHHSSPVFWRCVESILIQYSFTGDHFQKDYFAIKY